MEALGHLSFLPPNQFTKIDPTGGLVIDPIGKVFAIGVDSKAYNFYWTGNAWAFAVLNQNQFTSIDAKGKLTLDQFGKVFAIGKDRKIYNFYWTGSAWAFVSVSPQQTDLASSSNRLAVGDAVYFSNMSGFLEVLYYGDSQINYNDWNLVYDEDFTNTTISTLNN
jgi:hypothetical protein